MQDDVEERIDEQQRQRDDMQEILYMCICRNRRKVKSGYAKAVRGGGKEV